MKEKMAKKKNPIVFMDVSIDGHPVERMIFELFSDVAPQTAENFRALSTGERGVGPKLGKPLHYKGTFFHRIVKGLAAQGGDFLRQEGSAGESIYGDKFPDELPKLKHDEPGLLTMSVADRETRGSIFSLTFKPNPNLDRKNLVFGKLVHGHDVLKKIENAGDEGGRPAVTVKIINSGECNERDKKKLSKLKSAKDISSEANSLEAENKRKHKKSARSRKKRRRKYYTSESDTLSSSDVDTSESDSDFDSEISLSTDTSYSSDDRHRKRKRNSRRNKYRHGKKKDRRREKRRRRRDKRSKRRLRRCLYIDSDTESEESTSSSEDDEINGKGSPKKFKDDLRKTANKSSPSVVENEAADHSRTMNANLLDEKELNPPKGNGDKASNEYEREATSSRDEERQPDVVDEHPDISRSRTMSPKRAMSKSMSISPRSISRSPSSSPKRRFSRSPSVSRSPQSPPRGSQRSRSISRSPKRVSRKSSPRSPSRSSIRRSPEISPRRSLSPVRSSHRSISRSSGRPPSRRGVSPSPVRSVRRTGRHSYSRSRSPVRGARLPPSERRRSLSRSRSPTVSPKRIRRGRGFSERYSYARRYRTPSPDRSPVRSYRYGRHERDRYSSYRRYSDRSPRRFRSPRRSPPRYRSRRSRTRSPSISRSPPYRRRGESRSPIRNRSPDDTPRSRATPPSEKRSQSSSQSPRKSFSGSRSRSRSSSGNLPGRKGLVSYGDGSPDSGDR